MGNYDPVTSRVQGKKIAKIEEDSPSLWTIHFEDGTLLILNAEQRYAGLVISPTLKNYSPNVAEEK